ncbi:hypothetical protein BKE30_13695 [Alkanindiges hydrocarboniclasticus]|uniref:Uncharacterized protein n=1 Tax=Alkanindiges hydrocarboniclasticus TaxID=1907941 RepID=A0A1S8CQY1_9GAMM|nr:hypothetical protein [Alkanindiges hydrocarboniclasticus]ONG37857.1 hypothetical protein BKE30_13695 [Alkanindiges hydrocarboniclasticus]
MNNSKTHIAKKIAVPSLAFVLASMIGLNVYADWKASRINIKDVTPEMDHAPLQTGGTKPLYHESFKPSLPDFIQSQKNVLTPSSRIAEEEDQAPTAVPAITYDLDAMIEAQYYFDSALHAQIKGELEQALRQGTRAQGNLYISTRIGEVYPLKVLRMADGNDEQTQCVEVYFRFTFQNTPRTDGSLVDYWQDMAKTVCHSKTIKGSLS